MTLATIVSAAGQVPATSAIPTDWLPAALAVALTLLLIIVILMAAQMLRSSRSAGRREAETARLRDELLRLQERFDGRMETFRRGVAEEFQESSREQREVNALFLSQMRQMGQGSQQTLETVRQNLYEQMGQVAGSVRDLQSVAGDVRTLRQTLGGIRSRGLVGELQLARLLEDILPPGQFRAQERIRPGRQDAVDFVLLLPQAEDEEQPLLLPIDAKFPLDALQRLIAARDAEDHDAEAEFTRELRQRVKSEARKIADQYVQPPKTTDFAILYLPSETLFAEVMRQADVNAELYREHRVLLAGPSSMTAILAGLQAVLRLQTMHRRAIEIAASLTEVQREFVLYEQATLQVQEKLHRALRETEGLMRRQSAVRRSLDGLDLDPLTGSAMPVPTFADPPDEE